MKRDIDEMSRMLEDYLAFARGDAGEQAARDRHARAARGAAGATPSATGHATALDIVGDPIVTVRPDAFKRLPRQPGLERGALRRPHRVRPATTTRWLTIHVDDDGPGIPPDEREEVFKPFYRLDEARNQDEGGTGLGLAIARDIARAHGGDITLDDSPLGGLRATVRLAGVRRARRDQYSRPAVRCLAVRAAISITAPSASGKPSVSTSERIGPIWRGGKFTTAARAVLELVERVISGYVEGLRSGANG